MSLAGRNRIVILGMMTKMPVAGVVWQTLHYLLGFERLGYDTYYIEAHARTPSMLMQREDDDSSARAAGFIGTLMRRFDMAERWAFHALHADGGCYGMSEAALKRLYGSAALVINLHGGTQPLPEHSATGRLVYVETDPVQLQIELHDQVQETIDFLEPHQAFFTFGENLGKPGCGLPMSSRFDFLPTRQPVVLHLWSERQITTREAFTTVGNWRQDCRPVRFRGETYHWSKHREFLNLLDLPHRTGQEFEVALSSCGEADRRMLEAHGWNVRDGLDVSIDIDSYRDFVTTSRGEFTVAKDQNVRLRSGWFSDRSATYLAAGRPVITQETGFSSILPTGQGLLPFLTVEQAAAAITAVNADYDRHRRAAYEIAREYFDSDVVLMRMLADLGESTPPAGKATGGAAPMPLPADLVLTPTSKRPTTLPDATVETVMALPLPAGRPASIASEAVQVSIVIVTWDNLVFTRMCLESVLATTSTSHTEVVVVDNGSDDGTAAYLLEMANRFSGLRVLLNRSNLGFVRAANQGLAAARGDVLVLLNNDTVVPPGWVDGLVRHLGDPSVGMVGPVTNAAGNEAQIDTAYRTFGELWSFTGGRRGNLGQSFDIPVLTMFCAAMRRKVHETVGALDERFEVGMFEDDDYALRVCTAGFRVVCAEDVFVHHFGEASFGKLVQAGRHSELFRRNRRYFESKWGRVWSPHRFRTDADYARVIARTREVILAATPPGATVAVVSKGDDELLRLGNRQGWHFPQDAEGGYAGYYPSDSSEAVQQLEQLRARGTRFVVFPKTSLWWLDHYTGLRNHLESEYDTVVSDDACYIFAARLPG
jgi:GT2 family glycosyltransferase